MSRFQPISRNDDGTFGPTSKNHHYQPAHYHNKSAKKRGNNAKRNGNKSKWILKEYEQYEVFKLADEHGWLCTDNGGLFSIVDKGEFIVGAEDEILSFYDTPQNASDTWHGFPVKSDDKRPSSDLLDSWVSKEVVSRVTRMRIEKGKI